MRSQLRSLSTAAVNGCRKDPKRLIKYFVLTACCIIVVFQLTECFRKLFNPPVATHSYFRLNESVSYPAITLCRSPSYKQSTLAYYNLSLHPKMSNRWRDFRFDEHDLDTVFDNATYGADEMLTLYGLNGQQENVDIVSRLFFEYGRCHTIMPRIMTTGAWKKVGFSIGLRHDSVADDYDGTPAGWHMFLHEPAETFTEINMETSGRSEYMFVRVNEEIEVKLTAQHFNALPGGDDSCQPNSLYGFNRCAEACQWLRVAHNVSCTGPWMPGLQAQWPYCRDYDTMRQLMAEYSMLTAYNHTICGCPEPCRTIVYAANVMSRTSLTNRVPRSQLFVYYSSKMVTVYQEKPGYDLNQFVADIGGSLGFLLGLSVLGLILLLEKITAWLMQVCSSKSRIDDDSTDKCDPKQPLPTTSRTATLERRDESNQRL